MTKKIAMELTVCILIAVLMDVTAKRYTMQCLEHRITADRGSWVGMKSGVMSVEDKLEYSTQVQVDTNFYEQNGRDVHGSDLNICEKESSGKRDPFVQALWDIWQVEQSDCPIKTQDHAYATNITISFDSVRENLSKDQTFDMSMIVYRGIKAVEWLRIWYKCTMK